MRSICVGDNVIDYYVNNKRMYPGGNAVNVAVHVSKLGEESAYLGNFAADRMAGVIKRALDRFGVDYSHSYTIDDASTKYCNYNVIDGERTFLSVELGSNWRGPMELTEDDLKYISEFDVAFSSVNAKMENEMEKISRLDNLFVFDFGEKEKYRVDEYLDKVCPEMDLAMFSLEETDEESVRQFADRMLSKGVRNVLVTMGKAGQYLVNDEITLHGKTKLVEAVDTMGAGDSFLAAFVRSLILQGWKKGEIISREKGVAALEEGSMYSAKNCLEEGSFGYEILE